MSEKRFLEVRDSAMLLSGKAKEYDEDSAVKRLDAYLSELPDTAVIVFTVRGRADGRKKLYQALKKKAKIVSFDPLDDKELAQWIARTLKKEGKKISQAACQRLWFSAGRDLTLLNNLRPIHGIQGVRYDRRPALRPGRQGPAHAGRAAAGR